MIFSDGGMAVVQEMMVGGYMVPIPTEKMDAVTDALDSADIDYEVNDDNMNIDDMNEDLPTATVLLFPDNADIERIQQILDRIP